MSPLAVLAPVFVQVALTFALLLWLGILRVPLVTSRAVHPRDIALGQRNWPEQVTQVENAFANQFELPILFYALIALALATGNTSGWLVALSWMFVVLRLAHALVHITTNNVGRRFLAYTAGFAVLLAMWVVFAAEIAFGGGA